MGGDGAVSGIGLPEVIKRLEELERRIANAKEDRAELRAAAAEKVRQGAPLTRKEAAAFLNLCTRQLQRMEVPGKNGKPPQLRRCPGLAGVVRYEARDILRLASANGKEA